MYITPEKLAPLFEKYGEPDTVTFDIQTSTEELERIRSSQKNGRKHDFTLYIVKGAELIVIAKHFYPPGLYRAMSGGVNQGEDIETGIHREAMEETGCEIELKKFILKTDVTFTAHNDSIEWNSYILLAQYAGGSFAFTDRREIREVRLVRPKDFEGFSRIMRASSIGGLHYRAALHDAVAERADFVRL